MAASVCQIIRVVQHWRWSGRLPSRDGATCEWKVTPGHQCQRWDTREYCPPL